MLLKSLLIGSAVMASSLAFAKDGYYASVQTGYAFQDHSKWAVPLSFAGGYNYGRFSFEGELNNTMAKLDDGMYMQTKSGNTTKYSVSMLFANVFYNMNPYSLANGQVVTPFVGVGVAPFWNQNNSNSYITKGKVYNIFQKNNGERLLPYQVVAGAKLSVSESVNILGSLSYRNVLQTNHALESGGAANTQIKFGVMYMF